MIQHHGVGGIDGVSLGEELHPFLDGVVLLLAVELEDRHANQSPHAVGTQLQGPLEGQLGLLKVPKLDEANPHSESDGT